MHRKKRLILLFLLLILLLDAGGTLVTLRTFRQFTLEPEVLYGENGANLKEFTLDEDGVLTAQSDDPWVYYAFLTGNSLYFFPVGSSPYVQYTGSLQQSLAWKLRNVGYSTSAYHPYLPISYRRAEAYSLLGLEPFYSIEDELPCEEYLRTYISDRADFQNLIYLYEERDPEKPFFIFNVTMQNHGGYSNDEPAVDVTMEPLSEELKTPAFLEYLSLVHASDAAFQALVDYFSNVEEDTILLMFGDHQPSV